MVRILSIDGGGIRGIIPAAVLVEIEARAGKPITELFDFVAGTSTGGIIALGLTLAGGDGSKPRYSAEDLRDLYLDRGPQIFPPLRPSWLRTGLGVFDERHRERPLTEVLREYMGEARLKDALSPVLVPAYEIELRQPFFFRSVRAAEQPETFDYPIWQVARATSAAPTYFEAARIPSPSDEYDPFALVDGGVFANNPSMCAFADVRLGRHVSATAPAAEAREDPIESEGMFMVSLGTGELADRIPWQEAKDWGFYGWGRQLLGTVMDGVSDTADFQCRQLLGDNHVRIQASLEAGTDSLDDATPRNLEALAEAGKRLVSKSAKEIDEACERLT
jgi:patatin-like phospholipase/acyl hydrolase